MDRIAEAVGPPPAELTEVFVLRGRCKPRYLGYLNSIIASYDGMAVVRTADRRTGEVEFWATRNDRRVLEMILRDLAKTVPLILEEHDG